MSMALELAGKRVLVTGSSSGIGEGIAKRMAREGVRLVVHGRDAERTERVAAEIRATGVEAHAVFGDLAKDDQAEAVADAVDAALGGVDILINNAGGTASGGGYGAWLDATPEDWIAAYQGNVVATIRMIRRFVPGMKTAGWGRIVNIASIVGHRPPTVIPDYAGAKAALLNLTVGLSKTLSNTGITVNSITPGLILTPATESWLRRLAKKFGWGDDWAEIERRALKDFVPNDCGRIGRPEDIAHAVMYLASPQAGFVTGTDMIVTGSN
jgi:NAD(P)-dependent dehydrogenase (short-subunit alcohol dehydrogenase family)